MESWELIIVGAGAVGLAAGIYGARSGLKTLILEEKVGVYGSISPKCLATPRMSLMSILPSGTPAVGPVTSQFGS